MYLSLKKVAVFIISACALFGLAEGVQLITEPASPDSTQSSAGRSSTSAPAAVTAESAAAAKSPGSTSASSGLSASDQEKIAAAREALEDQILAEVDGRAPVAERPAAAVVPHVTLTAPQHASRFLSQATFGGNQAMIDSLAAAAAGSSMDAAISAWIDNQRTQTPTLTLPRLQATRSPGQATGIDASNQRRVRNEVMLSTDLGQVPDQLRQRVAYALSQILVISDNDPNVSDTPDGGSSSYYDMLIRNALGNYRTLLEEVTYHPMMGRYLSHYRNAKENVAAGTRPDENFAREIMQLFTIGLYELNDDGTPVLANGNPVESYSDQHITAFARVFTGFTDATSSNGAANQQTFPNRLTTDPSQYITPMRMWGRQHDLAAKTLLNGVTLPAVQTDPSVTVLDQRCRNDVSAALDNLFNHRNTPPFISRLLIQRLVTSNPTPGYVNRVASVFRNNGSNVRGDLFAVVKAILTDSEARDPNEVNRVTRLGYHGKLREPFLRATQILRAFNVRLIDTPAAFNAPFYWDTGFNAGNMGMYPMSSPSVFNFYSPDFEPPGAIAAANLVGPEFQIFNAIFGIAMPNTVIAMLNSSTWTSNQVRLEVTPQLNLAAMSNTALLDNVDLLLTHGQLSRAPTSTTGGVARGTYDIILNALNNINGTVAGGSSAIATQKVRAAIYLVSISPDFCIHK